MTDDEVMKLADECGSHKITHPTTSSSNFSYHLRQAELLTFTAAIEKLTEERVRAEYSSSAVAMLVSPNDFAWLPPFTYIPKAGDKLYTAPPNHHALEKIGE